MAMRRAHNRGAALNSEKNTYFLACDVDSNNYSFLNSTSIVTRRSHAYRERAGAIARGEPTHHVKPFSVPDVVKNQLMRPQLRNCAHMCAELNLERRLCAYL